MTTNKIETKRLKFNDYYKKYYKLRSKQSVLDKRIVDRAIDLLHAHADEQLFENMTVKEYYKICNRMSALSALGFIKEVEDHNAKKEKVRQGNLFEDQNLN